MSPEAQNLAIAQACLSSGVCFITDDLAWWTMRASEPFRPMSDLNAMHEAENVLTAEQCSKYNQELCEVKRAYSKTLPQAERWTWGTSAAQRAEAFLRTLGLWRDE